MIDEQLNLLEQLSKLSAFEENEAIKVWQQLLGATNNQNNSSLDPKIIRKLFSSTKQFADCTQVTQ